MKSSRMQGNPAWFILSMALALALYSCGSGGGGDAPPPPPTTTTAAATGISLHTATLNGTVNPHAQATNAWFEWGTDNTLASPKLTDNQVIGAGSADNSVSAPITGLTSGTTYYYRVAATNASGTQKGSIESFSTGVPNTAPTVTTDNASSVTISGAILNGTVNPNELAVSDAHFEYGTSPTLATFSTTAAQTTLGAGGTSVAITASLSSLTPGTTYYFRVVAKNSAGTSTGVIRSFVTVAQAPAVTTAAPTSVTTNSATLNGSVNPNGLAVTDAHFEYGTSPTLATFTSTDNQSVGSGFAGQGVTASLTGLTAGTTYYFRVAASNSVGTSTGSILSFNTVAQPPTVATSTATSVTSSSATLNGTVNPNGLATDAHFEWGTDRTLATFNTTSTQAMGSGGSTAAITAKVSGLGPGTTYYFRVVATNAGGTAKGTILSFPTPVSPTITTNVPTSITTASAIINGSVNPNGLSTTAWFEYGTDPSLSTWTNTANQLMGSGTSPTSYSRSISGLSSYTTYYFRAAASNSGGTQKGAINSFLTGETYVAVGDSITLGLEDDIIGDGIGYEPILGNLLGVMIANEGVSGTTSADGAVNIDATLSTYTSANYYLILYGTNDASLSVSKATYKANMQTIINKIKAAGKTPFLAKVPYATLSGYSDASIQLYNQAINELVSENGISVVPPDFYAWFQSHPSQLPDGLHPDGAGYQSMATMWFNALP